ncbi:TPA: hypothetical protein ACJTOQ_002603 [Klebsiella pneumoniae]|nr:hypothetical protein [Klebsiella pneumoniae]
MKTTKYTLDTSKKVTCTFHYNGEEKGIGITLMINGNKPVKLNREVVTKENVSRSKLLTTRALKKSAKAFVEEYDFQNYAVAINDYYVVFIAYNMCENSVIRIGCKQNQRVRYETLASYEVGGNGANQFMHYYGNETMKKTVKQFEDHIVNSEASIDRIEEAHQNFESILKSEIEALREENKRLKEALKENQNKTPAQRLVEAVKEIQKETNCSKQELLELLDKKIPDEVKEQEQDVPVYQLGHKIGNGMIVSSMFDARTINDFKEVCSTNMTACSISAFAPEPVFIIEDFERKRKLIDLTKNTITKL